MNTLQSLALAALLFIALVDAAKALPPETTGSKSGSPPTGSSVTKLFDRIWGYATLYENPDNPVLEKFAIRGRFQADFPLFESERGDYAEAQVRRFRLGFESHWLADLILHVEVDLDLSCEQDEVCDDDPREGLTDAYLGWAPSDAFELKVGKMSAPFTLDGSTSSTRLLTLERNNVSNNLWFPVEYHAGINVSGEPGSWRYLAGLYSSSTTEEFGSFDGGYFTLLTLARDFSKRLEVPELLLTLNYVYNASDPDNVSTRDLAHVASLNLRFDSGSWGVQSDLSGAIGYGSQSDLLGLVVMPFYDITGTFQVVGRYSYIKSFGDNGIRFGRYENRIEAGRGDQYHELFAGLNWFIYGSEFKLQTGFKYTWMDDAAADGGEYRGWGWTTGLRMSW